MVTEHDIAIAAERLRQGGVVAFPTETVYGLGANALDADAVAQVFEIKGRPRFDPLIVHIAEADTVTDFASSVPDRARRLIDRFWPGPLTLVLPKRPCIADIVTAGLPSLAIRCPGHELARRLIRAAGVPIAAPSANRFGRVSPTTAAHVVEQLGDRVPLVLDGGPCTVGVESTVVSFVEADGEQPQLLRPGGVTLEDIEAAIGPVSMAAPSSGRPASPGQLSRHYSPRTPLILSAADPDPMPAKVGLLSLQPPASAAPYQRIEILSEQGCLREAAIHLFAAMRRLDAAGLDLIVARPVPEIGLGRAIMDRLRRAAAKQ